MFKKVLSLIIVFAILCTSIVFAAEQPNYNVYEGYQSLKITCRNTDKFLFYGQTLKVEKNTDYTMSIWSKGGGSPSFRILTSSWSTTIKEVKLKGGTIWQENKATFNTANNDIIVFTVTNNPYGGNGTMFVDNAFLAKVSDGVNIVKNPSFENGAIDNWPSLTEVFSLEQSPVYVNPGDEDIEFEENKIEQPNGNNNLNLYAGHNSLQYTASDTPQSVTQEINVEKNTVYKASFWTKSPDSIKIDFIVRDASSNILLPNGQAHTVSSTPSWVRTELEFTTKTDTKAIIEFSSKTGQNGKLYIDYCIVVPKYKPKGMPMVNLIANTSFEGYTGWDGIEGSFSLYERTNGVSGDISGGVRVMTVGDSITAGVGSTSGTAGYKRGLYEKYLDYGANVNFVGPSSLGGSNGFPEGSGHAGFSGWRIGQIEEQIDGWIQSYQPQVILMMIGTNDILQDKPENNYAANAPARLEALVDKILATNPQIELYLASLTPLNNATNDQKVRTLNTEVERIATTKGNNVHFVDMYNAVSKSDLPDNVHPNNNGYAKMAQKWFDETKDAVKNMIPIAFIPDTSVAYDGMTSLKYHPYYVPYYTLLSYEIFSRGTIPVEENTNYTLTMMLKGDQSVSLQTRIQGSWGGDVFKSNTTMAGPKWRQHKIEFNTGNRDFIILTFINNCMSTGTMYIDCVELYKEGSDENLLTNSSFEEKTNGSVNNWSTPKKPFSFVEGLPPIESTLVLKSNDTPINKLQTGNISASVVLTNDYGIETGLLIAALYQGNKLVALSVDQTTSNLPPGGQETLEATLSVTHVDENTALKIMLFDSPTKLQPCMKRVVVSQTGIKND